MKFILCTLIVLALGTSVIHGQVREIDSLNTLLAHTGQDTSRVMLLIELVGNYQFSNSDRSISLINEALELARKLNFKKGEIAAISRQGEVFHLRGELPQALEAELLAIAMSRKHNFPQLEAESLTFLATIYLDLAEYRQALNYLFQAHKIYRNFHSELPTGIAQQFPAFVLSNIAEAYEKLKMIDSASHFQKLALNYPIQLTYPLHSDILIKMGIVEMRQKKYNEALDNFRQSLNITYISNDLWNRSVVQYQIASLYRQQANLDSALHYSRLAFLSAEQLSQKKGLLDASIQLSELYKMKGEMDSAFHYLQTATNVRDSLFGLEKFHKLQLLTLSEQQRVQELKEEQALLKARMQRAVLLISVGIFLLLAIIYSRSNRKQKKANHLLNEKNLEIEIQSESLKKTIKDLKSTQSQLIQSEKMASLGELTAGIAHEIQNPLNFVNNFSEVSKELLEEMLNELKNGDAEEVNAIADDVIQNLEKILHHGKRADSIVKGMLEHSRTSSGEKQPTDINGLCDEYLRLAYHGLRAKDKSFNAQLKTDFDENLDKVNVVPQEMGRVILNLINNAFYAVNEKSSAASQLRHSTHGYEGRKAMEDRSYEPTVCISTKKITSPLKAGGIEITVTDNGNGIPDVAKEKIFQPFFTTKPTGQGTGLGLSLSYDIVKAHNGELSVRSKVGKGTEFLITLPVEAKTN